MHTHSHFAAEPEHDQRKRAGFKALILLSSLFALSVWAKRFKWAPIMSMYMKTARMSCLCFVISTLLTMFSPQDCVRPTEGPPPLDTSGAHSNSKMIYLLPCRVVDRPWGGWLVNVQVHGLAIEKRYSANGRAAELPSYKARMQAVQETRRRSGKGKGKGKGKGEGVVHCRWTARTTDY